jgi:uncharacterized protein YecE (DUF72 family)
MNLQGFSLPNKTENPARKLVNQKTIDPDKFLFRNLHHRIKIGTTSDRYSGWLNQIYTPALYAGRITKRTNRVGGKSYTEEVLPIDSLIEYFQHFDILEIDYTFYSLLLEPDASDEIKFKPTNSLNTLTRYKEHLKKDDGLILKVPQVICAKKIYRAGKYVDNDQYLNPEIFTHQFYEPAVSILGPALKGFIFEQEKHWNQDRQKFEDVAHDWNTFFGAVPKDKRYHLELRHESYLKKPVFEMMRDHNVGQVLSSWTWLPRLLKQFAYADNSFTNLSECIIRLNTPMKMSYEKAYEVAFPFDKLVDGMMQPETIPETVTLIRKAIERSVNLYVIINNRAGGNAPMIAREIVNNFLSSR